MGFEPIKETIMLSNNKKRIVHIRFTASDFDALSDMAARVNMTVSEYVRLLVKSALVKAPLPRSAPDNENE